MPDLTPPFVHLHVHTQYSLLDGQSPIDQLVDKAIADGMKGMAITDHGNMFGIKEFFNYVNKKNSKVKDRIKGLEKELAEANDGHDEARIEELSAQLNQAKESFFKPIFGCEMYVAQNSMHEQVKGDTGRHLVVLAKNETGYHNLIKLVSKAWTEGFYSHPRTDREHLASHREGLIIASACLGGELPRLIMDGRREEAEQRALWYKQIFGEDYYIELQRHPTTVPGGNRAVFQDQETVNPVLIEIARNNNIKLICTNDVHFVNEDDAEAHDRLICVSTNSFVTDSDRMHYTKQEWFKTRAEMESLFSDIPEAMTNTVEILDKVETYSIDHGPIMPTFDIPKDFGTEEEYHQKFTDEDIFDEFTRDENGNVVLTREEAETKIKRLGGYDKLYRIKLEADYLAKLAYEGAERRYGSPLSHDLEERIRFELYIMKTMGFPGYFLIVQDFINAARDKLGVSVGPGRGSAAGSAVAYCLGITQIDPIKYDLLFERFLNPDRISLPDIDIDFDDDGRADVLRYVTDKYGAEKVAHIITYGTMASKLAIKDVARVEQLPLSESDRLTKLIPRRMPTVNGKELKPTLHNCYTHVPEFKNELSSPNQLVRETLLYADRLEGTVRNTGVHACGVIICRDDITDWVPISTAVDKSTGDKEKIIVTQYEGKVIEETGLIKMDFLGLKTLSIIKEAVKNIKLTLGKDIDMDHIPIDDKATYQLYCAGQTTGTFQFESAGMQKYLRELQPSTFEDLIAMNALYRPGPMDYIPDFIARKHGRSPIVYDIPVMEKYLKDTYGVTVYQEQVMLLSRLLAGFTRGQSDTLRKAMGKKLKDKMDSLKTLFLEGGAKNGHDTKTLEKIWADWEKFASYAFNKSHATCYSWVAFQTAYLKANYPAQYMAAVLTRNRSDIGKLTGFMEECRKMGIRVKGPDVNESFLDFGVNSHGDIRFGLGAIKGIGEGTVTAIMDARAEGGEFKNIHDFFERVNPSGLNRRIVDGLATAGAFDCFADEIAREDFFETNSKGESMSDLLVRYGQLYHENKAQQGMSLFGDDDDVIAGAGRPAILKALPWADIVRLDKERDFVGIYLSAHPLDTYYMELNYGCTHTVASFQDAPQVENAEYTFGGLVSSFTTGMTKNGKPFGRFKIEDFSGTIEIPVFGEEYLEYNKFGIAGTPILIRGTFGKRFKSEELRFKILEIKLLDQVKGKMIHNFTFVADPTQLSDDLMALIDGSLLPERTSDESMPRMQFKLREDESGRSVLLSSNRRIKLDREFISTLQQMEVNFKIN